MDNAAGRGDGLEIGQRLLTPFQEGVPFHVSVILDVQIEVKCIAVGTGNIHLHRVVNDQINGHLWIDFFRIAAHLDHGISKCRQVHDGGHAGEILKNHTGRAKGDFASLSVRRPCGNGTNVLLRDEETIVTTQRALQQNPHRIGEVRGGNTVGIQGIKREIIATDSEGASCVERVQSRHDLLQNPPVYEENPSALRLGRAERLNERRFTRTGTKALSRSRQKWLEPASRP